MIGLGATPGGTVQAGRVVWVTSSPDQRVPDWSAYPPKLSVKADVPVGEERAIS
jgi:hypothetical protein